MRRAGWLLLVLATAAGGAGAALPRPPLAATRTAVDLATVNDPFPLRRIRVADANVPDLLKELEPGPTVRLARPEFESRVRAAGRAFGVAKSPPKVTDATYTADLDGNDLVGTAELGIMNAHGATGFAPLDPLRLAVREAKWADGKPALLVAPGAPAVWVDRPGRSVLRLNWSLAGVVEPGERRFELRVPPCPVAALELTLPGGLVPTAAADVLLTGPFDAPGKPGRRAWRLRFGGRARAEFAVRAAGPPGGVAQAKLAARYELQPGQVVASFEYDLRPARGTATEWAFTAEAGLRITDVATNNRAGWSVDPAAPPGGPRRVRVALRQPAPGGKVLITAVAPLPDPTRAAGAPLPAVRPLNTVLDDERVEVRVPTGLKVEAWAPGDYRLTDVTTSATGADQTRVLALVGTLLPPGADEPFRRMPSVRVAPAEAEFTTFERLEWHLAPTRSVLTARVSATVRRGPLFAVAVQPPPGYTLDRAEVGADELIAHVGSPVGGRQVLEFARPLAAGQTAQLRLEFRAPAAPGEARPFPAFAVVGAAERDGWLSVTAEPVWAVSARPGAGAVPGRLWAWLTTDARADARAVYPFRGREPDGAASLVPAPVPATADATVHLDAEGGAWTATTRLAVTTAGAPSTAVVFVPGPRDARSWKLADDSNAVADATPLPRELAGLAPLLAPLDPRAGLAGARAADGTYWVLRFAKPLAANAVLETTAAAPTPELPVPRLLSARQSTRLELAPRLKVGADAELAGDYIRLRPRPGDGGAGGFGGAYLVTAVRGPDEIVAAFGGTVRNGRGDALRLHLPAGAQVRGVCVAGRWLNPAACADREPDGALRVPMPRGAAVRFEVRYRLPAEPGWPTRRVHSPVPRVADASPAVARWWAFGAGVLPGWPSRPWDASADELPLLGGPLSGGEPFAVVTRSDDERVRVGESRAADALAGVLATGLLVVGLVAVQRRRARGAVVLAAAVALALLAVEVGPPWWARAAWPPLCAATVALATVLVGVAVNRRAPLRALSTGLLFLVPALAATGQPAAPVTVLIVSTPRGEEVVAARATLERLDALAKPVPPVPAVTAAAYDVATGEAGARVVAKFTVHAFRSGENVVALPLADARLERVAVDGVPAFPSSPAPGVYAVGVGGPGQHEVEVRFAATVAANGSERDLRFGVPEVPDARLVATLPAAARQPVAVGCLGRQTVTTGERVVAAADLGALKSVHLRWREGVGGAAAVKVREACVWDVTEAGADLTAAYLVRVEGGAVAGLRYEVPAELEVLRVAARTLDAPAGAIPLRDWTLADPKGGFRPLRVDFQAPASGRLLVVLECAPRKPITRQPVLRFPRVRPGTAAGEPESVYGLRTSRVQRDDVTLVGMIDYHADALKDFAAVPDLRLDPLNLPNSVRAFKPAAAHAELRPVLRVGDPATVRTATAWHVGTGRADGTGTVSWQSKEARPLLEFALPGARVLEVRGPDVVAWNSSGGRVQVWLRGGAREGAVEWVGAAAPADGAFDPAHPVVADARHQADDVRVRPAAGREVKPDRARGWQSVPAAAGGLHFRTDLSAAPPLRVQLVPSRP